MKLLDDLEKLHSEVTKGPWESDQSADTFDPSTGEYACQWVEPDSTTQIFIPHDNTATGMCEAMQRASLIVGAVNNLPKLIEVIRKQRDRLKEFELDMCPEIRRAAREAIAETDKILGE